MRLRKLAADAPALSRLAALMEPAMRAEFLAAVRGAAGVVDVGALAEAVASGSTSRVEAAAQLALLSDDLRRRLAPVIGRTFVVGVATGAEAAGLEASFGFDLKNPESIAWARGRAAALVTEVTDSTRHGLRALVAASQAEGISPYRLAREIREVVGLHSRQINAVHRFRLRLAGEGVDDFRAESRVAKYADAQLEYRSMVIARTETITAAAEGQEQLWERAAAEGYLDRKTTVRRWVVTKDDRLDTLVCFFPKTPVLTMSGWKPISRVKSGEYVLTHEDRFRPVMRTMSRRYDGEVVTIHVGGRDQLRVTATPEHPFLTRRGWIAAREITTDDVLAVVAKPCCITWVLPVRVTHKRVRHQSVHNLEVADDNSYVAGGFVVHNCEPLDGAEAPLGGVFEPGGFARPPGHPQCRCAVVLGSKVVKPGDVPAPPAMEPAAPAPIPITPPQPLAPAIPEPAAPAPAGAPFDPTTYGSNREMARDLQARLGQSEYLDWDFRDEYADENRANGYFDPRTRKIGVSTRVTKVVESYRAEGEKTPETWDALRSLAHEVQHSRSGYMARVERGERQPDWSLYWEEGLAERRARLEATRVMFGAEAAPTWTATASRSYRDEVQRIAWLERRGSDVAAMLEQDGSSRLTEINGRVGDWLREALPGRGFSTREVETIVERFGDDAQHVLRTWRVGTWPTSTRREILSDLRTNFDVTLRSR